MFGDVFTSVMCKYNWVKNPPLFSVNAWPELILIKSCRSSIWISHRFVSHLTQKRNAMGRGGLAQAWWKEELKEGWCILRNNEIMALAISAQPSRAHSPGFLYFLIVINDTRATLCSFSRWKACSRSACSCGMQPSGTEQLPPYSCGIWSSSITARSPSSTWGSRGK